MKILFVCPHWLFVIFFMILHLWGTESPLLVSSLCPISWVSVTRICFWCWSCDLFGVICCAPLSHELRLLCCFKSISLPTSYSACGVCVSWSPGPFGLISLSSKCNIKWLYGKLSEANTISLFLHFLFCLVFVSVMIQVQWLMMLLGVFDSCLSSSHIILNFFC
jgi:hypothetical protein